MMDLRWEFPVLSVLPQGSFGAAIIWLLAMFTGLVWVCKQPETDFGLKQYNNRQLVKDKGT